MLNVLTVQFSEQISRMKATDDAIRLVFAASFSFHVGCGAAVRNDIGGSGGSPVHS